MVRTLGCSEPQGRQTPMTERAEGREDGGFGLLAFIELPGPPKWTNHGPYTAYTFYFVILGHYFGLFYRSKYASFPNHMSHGQNSSKRHAMELCRVLSKGTRSFDNGSQRS